jgi:prepilin-type N-terminal cleavage/methylation domain-containing protein
MSKKTTQQSGFTLVEISLAMAIFTFMLLVVSMAYINIARLYNASTAARNVQQNNRFAMEQMSRVARTSSRAITVNSGDITGVCFNPKSGSQLFYLQNNQLRQATVSDCTGLPTAEEPGQVLTSSGTNAVRLAVDTSVPRTVTMTLWMASKTDLVGTVDGSGLQCKQGAGSEFCAVNKLTTTVELRGE